MSLTYREIKILIKSGRIKEATIRENDIVFDEGYSTNYGRLLKPEHNDITIYKMYPRERNIEFRQNNLLTYIGDINNANIRHWRGKKDNFYKILVNLFDDKKHWDFLIEMRDTNIKNMRILEEAEVVKLLGIDRKIPNTDMYRKIFLTKKGIEYITKNLTKK